MPATLHSRSPAIVPTAHAPIDASRRIPGTRCAAYQRALAELERLARHEDVTVLLEGESGTGKGVFARHLHASSPRSRDDFHIVVLSALDDGVASSELFGHVSGAYTDARQPRVGRLASAARGTVFLDEIGKASKSVQRKLLHAIEHREVWPVGSDRSVRISARIVAASNIPLETLVARGEFLPDLHARFGFFRVRIPALRERRADIPELVHHFLQLHALQFGYAPPPSVDEDLMRALQDGECAYNVRELESVVQRLLVEAEYAPVLTLRYCTGPLEHLRAATRDRSPMTKARAQAAEKRTISDLQQNQHHIAGGIIHAGRSDRACRGMNLYGFASGDPVCGRASEVTPSDRATCASYGMPWNSWLVLPAVLASSVTTCCNP